MATIFFITFFACNKTPEISQCMMSPAQPKVGDTVKISYIPGKSSPLLTAEKVMMMAQYYPDNSNNQYLSDIHLQEISMQKEGKKWITEIQIHNTTGCVLFNFASDTYIDCNDKKAWDLIVYNENNKPIKNAYTALARTYMHSIFMKREKNIITALNYLKKEQTLYPDNLRGLTDSWIYRYDIAKDDTDKQARINAEIDSLIATFPKHIEVLEAAHQYFDLAGDKQKAASILQAIRKIDPKNLILAFADLTKFHLMKNPAQQIQEGKKLLLKTTNKELLEPIQYFLIEVMLNSQQWDDAVKFVNNIPDQSASILHLISLNLMKAEKNLLSAEKFSRQSIALLSTKSNKNRPSVLPIKKWKIRKLNYRISALDTYGFIEYKLGKLTEANNTLTEVYEITKGNKPEINEHYIRCLEGLNKQDKVLKIARKAIEENHANDAIITIFKKISIEKTGDAAESDSIIAAARIKGFKNRKKEIADHLIANAESAPAFVLKTLNGKEISLNSLKGKTVIVDFWATWCSSCKSSFPYLQKFWEQHKNNPEVMVVAVNCWEEKESKERIKIIKKFMKDHNYTFPVLIDQSNKVVSAFKVSGLPTKMIVGPDGKIYFKDIGFVKTMVQDMNIELDLIKQKISK